MGRRGPTIRPTPWRKTMSWFSENIMSRQPLYPSLIFFLHHHNLHVLLHQDFSFSSSAHISESSTGTGSIQRGSPHLSSSQRPSRPELSILFFLRHGVTTDVHERSNPRDTESRDISMTFFFIRRLLSFLIIIAGFRRAHSGKFDRCRATNDGLAWQRRRSCLVKDASFPG